MNTITIHVQVYLDVNLQQGHAQQGIMGKFVIEHLFQKERNYVM